MKPDYTCGFCGKHFSDRFTYAAHTRFCTKKRKGHLCQYCNKSFKTSQGRGRHQLCHEEVARKVSTVTKGGSRLARSLAKKADKLRIKGMAYLTVAKKIDLMISALRRVD